MDKHKKNNNDNNNIDNNRQNQYVISCYCKIKVQAFAYKPAIFNNAENISVHNCMAKTSKHHFHMFLLNILFQHQDC